MTWWTSPDILSKLLNWVGVCTAILACATATLKFRYDVVKRASDQQKSEERKTLDSELKTKTAEALKATAELELKTRPKPFKERLKLFCDSVDPTILRALATGTTRFYGFFFPDQLGSLRAFSSEPEAAQFIQVEYGQNSKLLDRGIASEATIVLNPSLLQP